MAKPLRSDFSRLFVIRDRSGPSAVPTYQGLMRAGAPAWPQGDTTLIRIPDPDQYGKFVVIDKVPGETGLPSLTVNGRYTTDISELLDIVRQQCDIDLQVHMGECQNPRDFNGGWTKILVLEAARGTNWTSNELGALEPGDRATVVEEVPFQGENLYEIKRMSFADQAAAQVALEVLDLVVCDAPTCGECGLASNGCNVVFAITVPSGASPGVVSELIYTITGGQSWDDVDITSLGATESPIALACVGTYVIVLSQTTGIHYAPISTVTDGDQVATWALITTGLVLPAGGPRAIFAHSPAFTWIVGAGGYVYFTSNPLNGVTVQDAGSATLQNLNAVHGSDNLNVVAVGDSNAVIATDNGGLTWRSVTGPAVGVNLTSVFVVDENVWWVGTASGRLYYTRNAGTSWVEKVFSGSGAGQVRDIKFSTKTVGYMSHDTAAPSGRIFRTIDGGASWYIMPEGVGTIPTNQRINKLAPCADANVVYAGGLRTAGAQGDGIIVKAN